MKELDMVDQKVDSVTDKGEMQTRKRRVVLKHVLNQDGL